MTKTVGAHIAATGKRSVPQGCYRLRNARRLTPAIAAFLSLALLGTAMPSWGIVPQHLEAEVSNAAAPIPQFDDSGEGDTLPTVSETKRLVDIASSGQEEESAHNTPIPAADSTEPDAAEREEELTSEQSREHSSSSNSATLVEDGEETADIAQSIVDSDTRAAESGTANQPSHSRAGFRRATNDDPIPAVFATGGAGRFKDTIQWLQWNDPALYPNNNIVGSNGTNLDPRYVAIGAPGQGFRTEHTVKNSRHLGEIGRLITTCTMSNLVQRTPRGKTPSPLLMTIPGDWIGTSFDNLYNVGGAKGATNTPHPGNGVTSGSLPNRMVVSLATGIGGSLGHGSQADFDLTCTAELVEGVRRRNVPLSDLVFSDAESSSGNGTLTSGEWVRAKVPNTVTWRVLDRIVDPSCQGRVQRAIRTQSGSEQTVTLVPGGSQCNVGLGSPIGVVLMEGTNTATIGLKGSGLSEVALGLILNTDYGDAPRSYGTAASLYNPEWSGGTVLQGTDNSDLFAPDLATLVGARNRLGTTTTHEREPQIGDAATEGRAEGDGGAIGQSGADDGISNPEDLKIITELGGTVTRTISCRGNGPVKGWIDWDGSGNFQDATEGSNLVTCSGNQATLRWSVPANAKRAVPGEQGPDYRTYMRLRTADPGEVLKPTGTTIGGEIEDYRVSVYQPTIELVKRVTQNSFDPNPLPAESWTLKAQQGSSNDPGKIFAGQGGVGISTAIAGIYTLTEESADPAASYGYEAGPWQCTQTPGTVQPVGYSHSSTLVGNQLTLRNRDRVTCTITNSPKPGKLRWTKVDHDGTTPLEGVSWRLIGPSHPTGVRVDDCVAATATQCTGHDRDHRAGEFLVDQLVWGEYSMTEVSTLDGYVPFGATIRFAPISGSHLESQPMDVEGRVSRGKITNKRLTGAVRWRKTDPQGAALAGSAWRINTPGGQVHTVVDCESAPCPNGDLRDTDPAAGSFNIQGLPWDDRDYSLVEHHAPVGYVRSPVPHPFRITRTALNANVGQVTNEPVPVPAIPFTGGESADSFMIAGGLAAALATGAGMAAAYKRRKGWSLL